MWSNLPSTSGMGMILTKTERSKFIIRWNLLSRSSAREHQEKGQPNCRKRFHISAPQHPSNSWFYALFRHCIIPYLGGIQPRRWDTDVQARSVENARAHAHCGGDICGQRIVVRVILLDHADNYFSAARLNALALP